MILVVKTKAEDFLAKFKKIALKIIVAVIKIILKYNKNKEKIQISLFRIIITIHSKLYNKKERLQKHIYQMMMMMKKIIKISKYNNKLHRENKKSNFKWIVIRMKKNKKNVIYKKIKNKIIKFNCNKII